MNFCPKCRKKLVVQDFCVECGADLTEYLNATTVANDTSLGSFDFSSMEKEAKRQLKEQREFEIENGVLVKYGGNKSDVVVPSNVIKIGRDAFSGCATLRSISLPSGLRIIECRAFENCNNLKEIAIPNTVEEIEGFAFRNCSSLTDVKISTSNRLKSIWSGAFCGCLSLKELTVPAVENKPTFGDSEILELFDVTCGNEIPKSLKKITVLGGKTIAEYAFVGINSVEEIIIPSTIKSIGRCAFMGCSSLKKINLPIELEKIEESAFQGCHSLSNVVIPARVKTIENHAFRECFSLTQINLPDSVSKLGRDVFWNCTSLSSISMPRSLTDMGNNAFGDNNKNIVYRGSSNDLYEICYDSFCDATYEMCTHYRKVHVICNDKEIDFM